MPKRNHPHTFAICKKANRKILADRIQADLLLEYIQLNARRTIHDEKRSYPCKFGDHWHLTSQDAENKIQDIRHSL
jgi:hypothetical protein